MKKFLLSTFVILTFVAYALHGRSETPNSVTVPNTEPGGSGFSGGQPTPQTSESAVSYADGQYTGDSVDAYYGNVQVKVTIRKGAVTDVQFLDYPQDRRHSVEINMIAMPYLKTEAVQAQNANVDVVTGATQTSLAFIQSLQSALKKAKA